MSVSSVKTGLIRDELLVGNTAYDPIITGVGYLVVAGGAGGAGGADVSSNRMGGGGGAGGLRSTVSPTGGGGSTESALTLTRGTTYTVTVGAGGAGNVTVQVTEVQTVMTQYFLQ